MNNLGTLLKPGARFSVKEAFHKSWGEIVEIFSCESKNTYLINTFSQSNTVIVPGFSKWRISYYILSLILDTEIKPINKELKAGFYHNHPLTDMFVLDKDKGKSRSVKHKKNIVKSEADEIDEILESLEEEYRDEALPW